MVGGIALGLIESFSALWLGPEYAITVSFALLVVILAVRPTGLLGRRGFE
jgi:branched-chain amino acid transport system permease protein